MTNIPCCPAPLSPTAENEGLAYLEAMYQLCQIIGQRLNPDANATATYAQILENCQLVERIRENVLPQLRNKEACKSALDRLQHFAVRLHTAYTISVCCRPALLRSDSRLDSKQKKFLADKCKQNLTETVKMFLAMHQLSVIPTRSWAFTYHGLSSAVLLGILGETKADPVVRQLQGDLISALSATAAKEQTSPQPHIQKSDHDIELSGPLSRALTALKNIYDHGSVIGPAVKREGSISGPASGTRTPMQLSSIVSFPNGSGGVSQQALDPHQNAALAMAEMQQQQQQQQQQHQSVDGMPDFSGYGFPHPYPWSAGLTNDAAACPLANRSKHPARPWPTCRGSTQRRTCRHWSCTTPYFGVCSSCSSPTRLQILTSARNPQSLQLGCRLVEL